MRPSIVVIGSGDPGRSYETPLRDHARIPVAAAAIGAELARAGCELVVFSSSGDFIDAEAVQGYLRAGGPHVVVRAPQRLTTDFGVTPEQAARITVEPDPADDWEASYYRSVHDADGLVTIGGGDSTRIAGFMAVAQCKPVVAPASFGGGGEVVWRYLGHYRNDATPAELNAMGLPWTDDSAGRLVDALLAQRRRRARAGRRGDRGRTAGLIAGYLGLAAAITAIAVASTTTSFPLALICLLTGPLLAGLAGAILRGRPDERREPAFSAFRGLGAGAVTSLLYVASQLLASSADDPLTLTSARRLVWFVVALGLISGYTLDLVYARLRTVETVNATPIAVSADNAPATPESL
jgi:hypothetical protein